jgi:hypothetical protein
MALVSGFAGEHPERFIEAAATAPYPLAGDVAINGIWLSDAPTKFEILSKPTISQLGNLPAASASLRQA